VLDIGSHSVKPWIIPKIIVIIVFIMSKLFRRFSFFYFWIRFKRLIHILLIFYVGALYE
jgi:hypothetical protein